MRQREKDKGGIGRFGAAAVLGGLAAYFFDPETGRRRRAVTADRARAVVRRGGSRGERVGRAVGAKAYGMSQRVKHRAERPKDYDDATLARKVETELFRPAGVPKGKIAVNAADGVVQLRGEADSAQMINDLVERARSIQGVRDVENLLHLPNTKAPMHQ
jgi:hypothetical protein